MAKINKCIELLAQGQPIYLTHPTALTYEAGLQDVGTWADMLLLDFEHRPFDYSSWNDPEMTTEQRVNYSIDVLGVKMMGAPNREWADYGRQKTGRTMPV